MSPAAQIGDPSGVVNCTAWSAADLSSAYGVDFRGIASAGALVAG